MRRVTAILVLILLAGCSGGDDTTGITPDQGCTLEQPQAVALDPDYAEHVRACSTAGGSSLRFENVSPHAVVRVWPQHSPVTLELAPLEDATFEAQVTDAMARSYSTNGDVFLTPGRHLVATASTGAAAVWFRIMGNPTVATYAVKVVAKWVEDRTQSPGEKYAKGAAECAKGAAKVLETTPSVSWKYTIGEVINNAPPCVHLTKQFYDDLRVPRSQQAALAADEVAEAARSLRATLWDDAVRLAGRTLQAL
jgi:hypothetical protein